MRPVPKRSILAGSGIEGASPAPIVISFAHHGAYAITNPVLIRISKFKDVKSYTRRPLKPVKKLAALQSCTGLKADF